MGKSSINGPSAITMLNYCNYKANYTRREVPKKPKIHSTSTPFLKQFPPHQETPSLQIAEVSILNQPNLSILGWLSGVFMLFKRKEPPKLLKQDQPWTPKRTQCVRTEEVAQGHRFCTITIAIGCEKIETTTTYIVLLLFPYFSWIPISSWKLWFLFRRLKVLEIWESLNFESKLVVPWLLETTRDP